MVFVTPYGLSFRPVQCLEFYFLIFFAKLRSVAVLNNVAFSHSIASFFAIFDSFVFQIMSSIATMGYSRCAVLLIYISFVSCDLSILDLDILPPECKYVSVSSESGWCCCPNRSVPVETFRGRDNVYYRAYPYVRAECVSIFPESALRLRTFSSASLPAGIIALISCGAVGVLFACIAVFVFIVVLRRRRLEQARIALMRKNSSVHFSQTPLFSGLGMTLPTTLESRDESRFSGACVFRESSGAVNDRELSSFGSGHQHSCVGDPFAFCYRCREVALAVGPGRNWFAEVDAIFFALGPDFCAIVFCFVLF